MRCVNLQGTSFVFDNTFYICRRKINPFDAYEDIKLTNFIEEDVF